jgi:hypothetical protein
MPKIASSLYVFSSLLLVLGLTVAACGEVGEDAPTSAQAGAAGTSAIAGSAGSGSAGSGAAGNPGSAAGGSTDGTDTPFVSSVVSFTPGTNAGYGADQMPEVVLGGPKSPGPDSGSLDVLSLGVGGEVVLAFEQTIVDGEGVDFIVFENAFRIGGTDKIFEEPGEVAVSSDGETWVAFPCDPPAGEHDQCAGIHPVNASDGEGYSPTDPAVSGGDLFDLAAIGVTSARFVRIRDKSPGGAPPNAGFDLDAVSIVHAAP